MPRKKDEAFSLKEEIRQLQLLIKSMMDKEVNTVPPESRRKTKKRGRPKGEIKTILCVSMPQKLYLQLKNYVEHYGDKGETISSIINAGAEKELRERLAKKLARISLMTEYEKKNAENAKKSC